MTVRLTGSGAVAVVAVLLAAGWDIQAGQGKSQAELRKMVVGTWRLLSMEGGTAESIAARGVKPTGLIMYDGLGFMSVQVVPDRPRPKWTGVATPAVAFEALRGYAAYFGTYTIDEAKRTITHHRQGMLNGDAVDYVRAFELIGNRIILTTIGGATPPTRLTWERLQ
jgi:hypothetical protein